MINDSSGIIKVIIFAITIVLLQKLVFILIYNHYYHYMALVPGKK